jgi:hypothetical protein
LGAIAPLEAALTHPFYPIRLAPNALICAAVLCVLTAACTPAPSQAQGENTVGDGERKVDWAGAQKDAAPTQPGIAAIASAPKAAFDVQVQTASVGSPVPMLAPPSVAVTASGLESEAPVVRVTDDGYFATFEGPRYDVTVHGTKAFYMAPAGAPGAKSDMAGKDKTKAPDTDFAFALGEGEAQVTFRRYGADYMIQFACKTGPADAACISRTDAIAFARRLQLVSQ